MRASTSPCSRPRTSPCRAPRPGDRRRFLDRGVLGRTRAGPGVRQSVLRAARPARCDQICAVAMDMHIPIHRRGPGSLPQRRDRLRPVPRRGQVREVIDRVRVDEPNRLKRDKPARQVIKSSRWLLLRSRENVTRHEGRVRLSELLHAKRAIAKAYLMRDELKHLWTYRTTGWADRGWADWYRRAVRSRIEPLATVRQAPRWVRARHHRPRPLAASHQPARRYQQHDQGHQANGLRSTVMCAGA
jgi:hypothetical protein